MIKLLIRHGTILYSPDISGKITWSTTRKGAPGKLTFSVLYDDKTALFSEGDAVQFSESNSSGKIDSIFKGYIFEISKNKDGVIDLLCYDQLRYFKNRDTYVYTNKRADEVLRMLCNDFGLKHGTLENTGYRIPSRIENNTSLFEIVQNALDLTLENRRTMYVLYDNFGVIQLKNVSSLTTNILIDASTAEDFDFRSGIDKETYNRIKLIYDNPDTGKREIYTAASQANAQKWGVLQYTGTLQKNENGREKARSLLALYNTKSKSLSIRNAFGHNSVRAGSTVFVRLDNNGVKVDSLMLVEKCTHEYSNGEHFMNIELRGGDINA